MNKAEIIKGIDKVMDGLKDLRSAIENGEETAPAAAPAKPTLGGKKNGAVTAKVTASAPAKEKPASGGKTYTMNELVGMKYNEFKKLAASLGVDCKGTRDEIMNRVIDLGVVSDADSASAPASPAKNDKKPALGAKSDKSASVGKLGAKKADAPAKDEFDEQAEEIAKDTPVEDIISALDDVGIKASKLNYKTVLAKALREGKLTIGDDDEEGGEEESSDEEMVAEDYYSDYDLSGANDPENMTEERSAACIEKQGAVLEAFQSDGLTEDELVEYLNSCASEDEIALLGENYTMEQLLMLYIEVAKHYIDNEGNEHEPGDPYEIGETNFCCGQPLAYDKKTKNFICSHCAAEYSAQ